MKALAATSAVVMALFAATVSWFAISADQLDGEPHAVVALKTESRPRASLESSIKKRAGTAGAAVAVNQGTTAPGGLPPVKTTPVPGTQGPAPDGQGAANFVPPAGVSIGGANTGEPATQDQSAGAPATVPAGPIRLANAPIDALVESSRYGPLPKVSLDGRHASTVYARPSRFRALPRSGEPARIAILINGLGLSEVVTTEAINKLPGPVTLAFGPYGRNLQGWVRQARSAGHEVMLQVPLEPFDYPDNDPGPHTLLTSLAPEENMKRLHWIMSRFTGYTGVTNHMGAKFAAAQSAFLPVLEELKSRGLIFLDDGTSARSTAGQIARDLGLGFSVAQVAIDAQQAKEDIKRALAQLEVLAKENGLVIGVGTSLPVTIQQISKWSKTLADKNLVLIPVSAAVRARPQS
ncbi:MAG: divergent polysaccharide deacetylase family protein [Methyloligellaceae bacterium]